MLLSPALEVGGLVVIAGWLGVAVAFASDTIKQVFDEERQVKGIVFGNIWDVS